MLAVKRFLILLTNFTEELTDKRGNGPQADRVIHEVKKKKILGCSTRNIDQSG
jgi:hypothetical protein